MPLRKIVIAQWLLDLGRSLGARSMTYVPNGIDHNRYRLTHRSKTTATSSDECSHVGFKRSQDGIAALQLAKSQFPDLRVVLFGNSYRPSWVPEWMIYEQDPPQDRIVDKLYNGSSIMLSPSQAEVFRFRRRKPPLAVAPSLRPT